MSWIDGVRHRVRTLLSPGSYDRELRDEMRFHLELDAMQQRDMSRARRRFGNRTWHQEEARRMTPLGFFDVLGQDARFAWRSVRRAPGFTAMIVVTLALGLGVNAASFSVLDALFLRPPGGVHDPAALRRLWFEHSAERMADRKPYMSPSAHYPMYRAVSGATGRAGAFAVYATDDALRLGRSRKGPTIHGVFASASYFSVLGVRPMLGRVYTPADDSLGNGRRVVVVSRRFWERQLGGDPEIIGRDVDVGLDRYTVIGVLPPEFTGLDLQPADAWFPLAAIPSSHWLKGRWWEGGRASLRVIRRAPPDDDVRAFLQTATLAARQSERAVWPNFPDTLLTVHTGSIIEAQGPGKLGQDLIISSRLSGVALIVLLIACANVINLLLARAVQRRREIAVRLALGISRARLVRLLTTETLVLAVLAGVAAILAAWWGGTLLRMLLFPETDFQGSALHWRVILFAAATALAAGVVAGVVPAIQASNPELTPALKDGAKHGAAHRSRVRTALVVAQAALSVTLLVGAALFVRSLHNVQGLDIGYDADRLLFGYVTFEPGQSMPEPVVAATMADLEERLRTRPGVEVVARAFDAPMRSISFLTFFFGNDSSASLRERFPTLSPVSATFFDAAGLRIIRGTTFEDRPGAARQLVVNEAFAEVLWPNAEPLGQCIRFEKRDNPCYTVAGVVENARRGSVIEDGARPQYYLPLGNLPVRGWAGTTLVVRTHPDAGRAASAEMRSALRSAFPTGDATVKRMTENLEPEYRPWRLGATLFTAFGLLALLVALIGIYSTVAYGVTQRRHEFGVRIALGARMGDVLRQVVGEGLRVVAIGVVAGIALTLAGGKLISALLYGIEPGNPGVIVVVCVALLLAAAAAALVPAWRAGRLDPVTALRSE